MGLYIIHLYNKSVCPTDSFVTFFFGFPKQNKFMFNQQLDSDEVFIQI